MAADGLGDNRRALAAYGEMIADYPKHPRASLALLRQGSVFIRLGDVNTARLCVAAGADVLVAGTATFKGGPEQYAANIAALKAVG